MLDVMAHGPRLIDRQQPGADSIPLVPFGNVDRRSACMMYVPVREDSKVIGILSIQSYRAHAYTKEDLATLQALSDHCGGALERIRVATILRMARWRQ